MSEQSITERRSPIVLSPNLILTDADLLSYLTGNGCPEALNELGLDIFQPERSMIDAEGQIQADAGREVHMMLALDPVDRFQYVSPPPARLEHGTLIYVHASLILFSLPPGTFEGCYSVPHWVLPPLYRLCKIASHTLDVLTSQMSIIHEPTFKLSTAYGTIAFAMCTVGTGSPLELATETGASPFEAYPNDPWKWLSSVVREQVRHANRLRVHYTSDF